MNLSRKRFYLSITMGVLAILFGLIALFYPVDSIVALASVFGIFVLLAGILLTITFFHNRRLQHAWLWLIEGILNFAIGIYVLFNPQISAKLLLGLMGIWAVFVGFVLLYYAYRTKHMPMIRFLMLFAAVLSVLLGIVILINPFKSATVILSIIGIFAIVYGVVTLVRTPKVFGV